MLGTFTLAELFPELKDFLQAKASAKAVFEVVDQVRNATFIVFFFKFFCLFV